MATIKEVAEVAGVSTGSVSNVINGKTNNHELIDKVEKAIKELGFRPDAKARSLKNMSTKIIGLIVNNIEDPRIYLMIAAIEKEFRSSGYSIIVKTTDNNEILEKKQIEYFIQQRVDGLIISTTVKKKKWLKLLNKNKIPVVFMDKKVYIENQMNIVLVNYKKALDDCLTWCQENQYEKIGFILEDGIILRKELKEMCQDYSGEIKYKIIGDYSIESGFKAAYELLYEHPGVSVLVASSLMIAEGAKKAIEMLKQENHHEISLVCIKAENWIEDDNSFDAIINISYYELGRIAVKRILEAINKGGKTGTNIQTVNAVFQATKPKLYSDQNCLVANNAVINVAILDAEVAMVLQMLTRLFEKETGIKINFITLDYYELWSFILESVLKQSNNIDVFMFDLIWIQDLVEMGALDELTCLKKEDPVYFEGFIDGVLESYSSYGQKLYGLPFMTGTQLLFYQQDLFEDPTFKIQFKRKYGTELMVPRTWDEFNLVAEFFSKKYNKNSPVKYGCSLITEGNLYNSIEFLNRLWAYGGAVYKKGKVSINNNYAAIALDSYQKSFNYTDTQTSHKDWDSIADDFKKGSIAMAVLYDSYAFGINDSMKSKVAGNVGSSIIPGKSPVLGGWSLGVSQYSKTKKIAIEFIKWACGKKISNPFSVLSGISDRKAFYMNKELDGLYPWKRDVLKSYAWSRKREVISNTQKAGFNIELYSDIMGREIGKGVRGEKDIEEVLNTIEERIIRLLEEYKA
ncbi:MAG: extracellular solute-binding protein [Firmicutes bacterium]|nr:extracellular solute-binding protein [Bacillota bacterium]